LINARQARLLERRSFFAKNMSDQHMQDWQKSELLANGLRAIRRPEQEF
jgi:hypothetical protein